MDEDTNSHIKFSNYQAPDLTRDTLGAKIIGSHIAFFQATCNGKPLLVAIPPAPTSKLEQRVMVCFGLPGKQ